MSLRVINELHTIDPETETHYAYHRVFDLKQYPQVHDFYEIALITSGTLRFTVGDRSMDLSEGNLLLLRPGDIHSKEPLGATAHINLAVPAKVVNQLFSYMNDKKTDAGLLNHLYCSPVSLSAPEFHMLQQKLTRLSLIPPDKKSTIKTHLRLLLAEVIDSYFIDRFQNEDGVKTE
jgi:AraC family cel operon transcriptional repressor